MTVHYSTGIIGNVQVQEGYKDAMGMHSMSAAQRADLNGWVTSSLNLAGALFCLISGWMGDYVGRKRAMVLGCIVNIIGALAQ